MVGGSIVLHRGQSPRRIARCFGLRGVRTLTSAGERRDMRPAPPGNGCYWRKALPSTVTISLIAASPLSFLTAVVMQPLR